MITLGYKAELLARFGAIVDLDVPLNRLSQWKIGGVAKVVLSPRDSVELSKVKTWLSERKLSSVVIGATSNLLFSDDGLNAVCILIGQNYSNIKVCGSRIVADPGVWVPGLARRAMTLGLTGLEHTCGIPGTLGGLVYMNGGSQRRGIGEVVSKIESVDSEGQIVIRDAAECQFDYRSSIFQEVDEVISGVELSLGEVEGSRGVRSAMLSILRERRHKFPRKTPNCGSVFVSNPAMYAEYGPPGQVVEQVGLKGYRVGGLEVSSKHANFILNNGGASSKQVLSLIKFIRDEVFHRTGYMMDVEVRYVSSDGVVSRVDDYI